MRCLKVLMCLGVGLMFAAPAMAQQPQTYADVVTSLQPTHWWRLGEAPASPTAIDSIGDLDGAHHNVTLGQPGSVLGDPDTSGEFYPSFVEVPHDASLLLDHGSVSFCFQDLNAVHRTGLISKDSNGYDTGGHLSLFTNLGADAQHGTVQARLQSDSASFLLNGPTYATDVWNHVVFTWGGQGMQLFFNGALVDANDYTGGLGATSGGVGNFEPLVFGASLAHSADLTTEGVRHFFSGLIDEVTLFGYQLDGEQVTTLYQAKSSTEPIIPEPTSLALLASGAVLLLRRRRRA